MTRRRLETWRAGTVHALEALKLTGTGEWLGEQWGRGRLGAATEVARPRLGGPESGAANTQDTARLGVPYTGGAQITVDWRRIWRWLEAWQAGRSHSLTPFKPLETGERRCVDWRRGALGAAMH